MKRYASSGNNSFVRFGLKGYRVRTFHNYRGGVRR